VTLTVCLIPGFRTLKRCAGRSLGYSPDLGYAVVQSDVATEVEEGTRVFEKMGHKIEEVKQGPPDVGREWGLMGSFEIAAQLYPLLPEHEEDFGRSFIAGVKAGWNMTPETIF